MSVFLTNISSVTLNFEKHGGKDFHSRKIIDVMSTIKLFLYLKNYDLLKIVYNYLGTLDG